MSEPITYQGGAFHESLSRGKAGGTLRMEGACLVFEAGTTQARLPVAGLQVRFGGAADRLIFFTSPAEPGWTLFTPEREVLKEPMIQADPAVARQVGRLVGRRRWGRALTVGIAAVLLALAGSLVLLKDPFVAAVTRAIPPEMERTIGEAGYQQAILGRRVLEEPEFQRSVEALVQPLMGGLGETPYDFQFHLVEDPSVNAFALPGGVIVLHTGFLLKAETPEEVLGVLAHEIAHVTRQHSMRNLVEATTLALVVDYLVGDLSGLGAALANNSAFLLQMRFSRDHEADADAVGLQYLHRAGVDPRGLVTFFEKLRAEEGETAVGQLVGRLDWISTHPATADRIRTLENAIDALPARSYSGVEFDLPHFQAAITRALEAKEN